jgi:hypothetical protein
MAGSATTTTETPMIAFIISLLRKEDLLNVLLFAAIQILLAR